MRDDRPDELAGEGRGGFVAFVLGEVALENGVSGALAEVGFEDAREGEAAAGPVGADPVRGTV